MEKQSRQYDFEYWGGVECTFNRVEDTYHDQLHYTGHIHRLDDIDRFVSLGINKIRYPVLWESHEPVRNKKTDWSWARRRLERLSENNVTPIVGLIHHGSGPSYTSLADPAFAEGLARYASRVANEFPWLEYYTPVNEPLTTARFSGLYGFWFPHMKSDAAFLTMLVNQVKGIILSMREIRKVNPDAKLVQTEDLSKTYSTPALKYQADFENERRWLSYDLLCGKVDRNHTLWKYLLRNGLTEKQLGFFLDNPCYPDIAGFNYYVTSERFLDDAIRNYPSHLHGGNGKHRYVDTEAIRVEHPYPFGIDVLLREAWERYGLPMAVTEMFISCTQDEQVRWLHEVHSKVQALRSDGVNISAVTFWALLGEYGWNTLVTSSEGEYEYGAFDVMKNSEFPEETLTATYIRSLTHGHTAEFDGIADPGWWARPDRYNVRIPCLTI